MRSLNLSCERARNCCCCCGVKKLTIFDPSHFNVKRGCGEIPRDLSQKSVTLTWQQRDNNVPTASEHYWSIVCFSWRGSFCRQPMILLWPGVRTLTLTSDNVRNCEARKGLLSSFWEPWSRNWRWQGFLLLRSDSKYKRWRGRSIMIKGLTATDIFKVF